MKIFLYKKRLAYLLVGLTIITILYMCVTPVYKAQKLYVNDWAIYNYGQVINTKTGVKGIDINIIPAWQLTKGDSKIKVAIIDTGIDLKGPNFFNTTTNQGYDFYNNDTSTYDSYIHDYHGTYVASTIAEISPEVTIIPIKFMESTTGSTDDIIKSIKYAIEHDANIINCSWNFYDFNEEIYNIIKKNPNVLFVCAAGNYNADIDNTDIYPCKYNLPNIINVMAINNTGKKYDSSGFGKKTVHIAAPGEDVLVNLPGNDTALISGTSVATAFVTGTAALILSIDDTLSPEEVIDYIVKSASKNDTLSNICISGGYLNVMETLKNILEEN